VKFGTKSGKILQKNRALWLINEDFEWAAENLVHSLEGYDIVTNLPYGKMSSENDNSIEKKNALSDLYSKFDKFLHRNMKTLGDVYLIYPQRPVSRNHFIAESIYAFEEILDFSGGKFSLALYKCTKQRKMDVMALAPVEYTETAEKSVATLYREDQERERKRNDFLINAMSRNLNSLKMKKTLEVMKTQRRNLWLKVQKERWMVKVAAWTDRRNAHRAKKFQKVENRLRDEGMGKEDLDEFHRVIIDHANKKREKLKNVMAENKKRAAGYQIKLTKNAWD
jgi:hypothetical protein